MPITRKTLRLSSLFLAACNAVGFVIIAGFAIFVRHQFGGIFRDLGIPLGPALRAFLASRDSTWLWTVPAGLALLALVELLLGGRKAALAVHFAISVAQVVALALLIAMLFAPLAGLVRNMF